MQSLHDLLTIIVGAVHNGEIRPENWSHLEVGSVSKVSSDSPKNSCCIHNSGLNAAASSVSPLAANGRAKLYNGALKSVGMFWMISS